MREFIIFFYSIFFILCSFSIWNQKIFNILFDRKRNRLCRIESGQRVDRIKRNIERCTGQKQSRQQHNAATTRIDTKEEMAKLSGSAWLWLFRIGLVHWETMAAEHGKRVEYKRNKNHKRRRTHSKRAEWWPVVIAWYTTCPLQSVFSRFLRNTLVVDWKRQILDSVPCWFWYFDTFLVRIRLMLFVKQNNEKKKNHQKLFEVNGRNAIRFNKKKNGM